MIRNRHNQIPYPALKTKREMTKYIKHRYNTFFGSVQIKFKTALKPMREKTGNAFLHVYKQDYWHDLL